MWKNIIGQKRVISILRNIHTSGRIPHSFIFHGIEGVGKDAAAIEFAKLINCDSPDDVNGACDECKYCRQTNSLNSSIFKFITALPASRKETDDGENPASGLSDTDAEILSTELRRKSEDFYHRINIPKANTIRIDSIRQVRREIYLTPDRGKKKVFLISNADLMNQNSENAFLKILEEPPGESVIILTTSRINSLLPTVIGRCQKIKFDSIGNDDLLAFLKSYAENIPQGEMNLLVNVSNGSLQKLKSIVNDNFLTLRDSVIDYLRAVITNNQPKISNVISSVTSSKDKELVRQFLYLMILWFRDIIVSKSSNDGIVINRDRIDSVSKFSARYKSDEFEIINNLETCISDIDRNVNMEIMLYSLTYNLRGLIRIQ
ncbi:MAG TPA: DNA polymerase III subunit delta' C-terminal domain-containing protein [Ignavibacteria bacterium]|nr:DNA polymerase III subunit delta' C-terminal domain-containing protein [Ignavibacteria bacterium]